MVDSFSNRANDNEDDASIGKICHDGTAYYGTLIIEEHDGCDSLRIYRFDFDDGVMYRKADILTDEVICPECGSKSYSSRNGRKLDYYDQDHEPLCKFDKKKFHEIYKEANKDKNQWDWYPDPYPILEPLILDLLQFSKFTRRAEFRKLDRLLIKECEKVWYQDDNLPY